MPYFPQLTTGAVAQFPVSKRRARRTVLGEAVDGRQVKLADPGLDQAEWRLKLVGLSESEATAVEALFQESEGRLKEFVFLDPMANLLVHTEDLSQTVWLRGPLLGVTSGVADPMGTARAARLVNGGGGTTFLAQEVAGPGTYHYCLSFWARSASGTVVELSRAAGALSASESFVVGAGWRRVALSGRLETAASPVRFEIRLGPASTVDVFGLQVEAQPAASPYKRNAARGGVHAAATFGQDQLAVTADGVNDFSADVRIVSRNGA
jgi:hypothetical protein